MRLSLLICALAFLPATTAFAVPAEPPTLPLSALVPPAVHPVDGQVGYGEWAAKFGNFRHGHVHAGQDVFAKSGTLLRAVRDGVVVETGSGDGRGHYLALYSAAERETYVYFHMLKPTFRKVGDRLQAGDTVGRLGCTGSCFGDHLHFEIRAGRGPYGKPRDPLPFLRSVR